MTYDPEKVEDWVVGSTGFWRVGEVHVNEFIRPFTGTWEQAYKRHRDMMAMENRHFQETRELRDRQREERKLFWS